MPLAKEFVDDILRDFANGPSREEEFFNYALDKLVAYAREGRIKVIAPQQSKFFVSQHGSGDTEEWRQAPAARRKRLATIIAREIAMRADELKGCGVPNPIAQARKEAAKRWGRASGAALHRWLRRNR